MHCKKTTTRLRAGYDSTTVFRSYYVVPLVVQFAIPTVLALVLQSTFCPYRMLQGYTIDARYKKSRTIGTMYSLNV